MERYIDSREMRNNSTDKTNIEDSIRIQVTKSKDKDAKICKEKRAGGLVIRQKIER